MENTLLNQVVDIAKQAGDAIMDIYRSDDFDVETKSDEGYESPLTKADTNAHDVIEQGLNKISDYPVVSEEGEHIINGAEKFWLVDPLDGTKEFIKKNDEFTVNIALIDGSSPVLGVVLAPAKNLLYFADKETGAYKVDKNGLKTKINSEFIGEKPMVIASRSHRDERIGKLLDAINEHDEMSMGSSLKLCLIAEGKAQIYPRLAPTYLWDTAASHAVINIAGGRVRQLNGEELKYEPEKEMKNPFFVATTANDKIFESNKQILSQIN